MESFSRLFGRYSITIVLSLFVVAFVIDIASSTDEPADSRLFDYEYFKAKFNKKYTPEEDIYRKKIFLETVKAVKENQKLYKEGKVSYTIGINQFADMKSDEVPKGIPALPPRE